jgi:hypothetical protein
VKFKGRANVNAGIRSYIGGKFQIVKIEMIFSAMFRVTFFFIGQFSEDDYFFAILDLAPDYGIVGALDKNKPDIN